METKNEIQENLLNAYYQQIVDAHNWISFDPEKRAKQIIKDYGEELKEDLNQLGEKQGNYKEKYINYFLNWIFSKGRCFSSAITGGSNFNTAKAEKANRAEHNHFENFRNWREKYFIAVNRVKTLSPEDDLIKLTKNLNDLIVLNEKIKIWNKSIKKFKTKKIDEEMLIAELIKNNLTNDFAKSLNYILENKFCPGFGTLGIKIRKQKERVFELKTRIETKKDWKDIIFEGGKITIADDRVKVFHDEKPEQEIIFNLKKSGFRWSRYWNCWSRKHTINAINEAKRICL